MEYCPRLLNATGLIERISNKLLLRATGKPVAEILAEADLIRRLVKDSQKMASK
jgi:hypothetical protein